MLCREPDGNVAVAIVATVRRDGKLGTLGNSRMPPTPEKSFTSIVRAGLERACRDFTARVQPLGFRRTLKMFWTRRHPTTVDFIHFHRHGSTYGAPRTASVHIRVH